MFWIGKNINKMKKLLKNIGNDISMKVACFTGYRPFKCPWGYNENDSRCLKMKKSLKARIQKAIKQGYCVFICGMALGFDMICAEIVLELKNKYPHIKLVGALPCKDQDSKWKPDQQKRYRHLLSQLDEIRCIYEKYENGCMEERNRYMINNSSLVIALFDGKLGGTSKTLEYAKQQNVNIDIIKP